MAENLYLPVKTDLLVDVSPLQVPVYILIGTDRYLRIFQPGDDFTDADLQKYREKKHVENLYVEAGDIEKVFARVEEELAQPPAPEGNGDAPPARAVSRAIHVHETIHELSEKLGFTPELQSLTKKQLQANLSYMRQDWSLKRIGKALQEKGGFIADHSLLLSYFAALIANNTQWGSEQTSYKLGFAALLHDIKLKNQDLARCRTLAEARDDGRFTRDDVRNLELHTIRGVETVHEFKDVPHDVDTIILQHHERPDGSGFPRGLREHQIVPPAAIFIVAHELLYFARERGEDYDIEEFLTRMEPYYTGKFVEILEATHFA